MRILFLEKFPAGRLSSVLGEEGHFVTVVTDEGAARTALAAAPYQLVMMSVCGSDEGVLALMSLIRKIKGLNDVYLLVLGHQISDDYLARAYQAGADGDLKGPCRPALLAARLHSAVRFLKPIEGDPPLDGTGAGSLGPIDRVGDAHAWKDLTGIIKSAAAKFLTLEVTANDVTTGTGVINHSCAIVLSNVQERVEVRIALGCDAASARHLATHVFGPDGADLGADMLTELANIFMGTLKSALNGETLAFTGGLPESIESDQILRPLVPYSRQQAFTLQAADATVLVHAGVRSKANLFVKVGKLKEGMIVFRDFYNARGLLLAQSGTRLSRTTIEKIGGTSPPATMLEVMAP